MLFNSFSFLIFLPIVFVTYYLLPYGWRRLFLLLASCYFYMAFVPSYILVLLALIVIDYILAFQIAESSARRRFLYLWAGIIINLGILFFFKYFNFFDQNVAALAQALHFNYAPTTFSFLLPLGLSFHVFQSLSYLIEVYKKNYSPEKNFITFALYVMFFPQLVAGPIERPEHLLPQLKADNEFDPILARRGLERILWGFFKKLVIADQLALVVNAMYHDLPTNSILLIALMVMFAYQLYCDFSGYVDIAVGSAMLLGYNLVENFDRPYASRSIGEFWRRWHISLSSWLRDYLYYPLSLGWGRVTKFKLYLSSFITFTLIGLWHGANWTYIVFGMLHGMYLVIGGLTAPIRMTLRNFIRVSSFPRLEQAIQVCTVFTLVSISFVFFRSETISQAVWILSHLTTDLTSLTPLQLMHVLAQVPGNVVFAVTILSIVFMEIVQYYQAKQGTFHVLGKVHRSVRYAGYYFLSFLVLMFGYFGAQSFIYFQF